MPTAGVKGEKQNGGAGPPPWREFNSAQLMTPAQLGPEGPQAERDDFWVMGAAWLTEE